MKKNLQALHLNILKPRIELILLNWCMVVALEKDFSWVRWIHGTYLQGRNW